MNRKISFSLRVKTVLGAVLATSTLLAAQTTVPDVDVREQKTVQPAKATEAGVMVDQRAEAPAAIVSNHAKAMMRIGAGDLLEMKVYGVPELTDTVRVNGDGEVSLPLIGTTRLMDMSSAEAEKAIEKRLVDGGFLKEPHVSIFVKEYVSQSISVMGEVTKAGVYPLLGARRLFDAISAAGGTTDKAGKIVSITHKNMPEEPVIVTLSSDPAKNLAANIEIYPGDTIVVSKAGVVYVVGEVNRPSGFVMENNENLTVLQAIALAQGLGKAASMNNAKLIRKSASGLIEIPIPLKKILEGKSTDIAMQGEDILFVPASAGKTAVRRTLEAVVQTATGIAVYRR